MAVVMSPPLVELVETTRRGAWRRRMSSAASGSIAGNASSTRWPRSAIAGTWVPGGGGVAGDSAIGSWS